jgi:hypothetical protein
LIDKRKQEMNREKMHGKQAAENLGTTKKLLMEVPSRK